jgi:hypothetical protein
VSGSGLRLVFDPALDGAAWPGPPAGGGEAWVGPLGLLGRLETELGLGGAFASSLERTARLAESLRGRDGWWRRSFEADRLGAAARLLHDRDRLALWGWRGEPASERLAELWAATAAAPPGVPDRLRAVSEALARRRVDVAAVEVVAPLETLPTLWQAVLGALPVVPRTLPAVAATGDLAAARRTPFTPVGDGTLTILRAHGSLAAADEVAAALAAEPTLESVLVVGGDATLDAALARHGLPRLGAPGPAPASAALVRLCLETAFEPMEPADLHALLCLDPGPVPRRVAGPLVTALARMPSRRSDLWQQGLAEGLARFDDETARAAVAARLAMLLAPAARREQAVATSAIDQRLDTLAAWARARGGLEALVARVAAARELLARAGAPALGLLELRRLVDELEQGGPPAAPAQAGIAAVATPGAVLGPADLVVWWSFTRAHGAPPERVRLSTAERAALLQLRVTPPDAVRAMEGEALRWRRPLEQTRGRLLLVCPRTDEGGERAFPHPLWDELAPGGGAVLEVARLPQAARRRVPARPLPAPTPSVRTPAALPLRDPESPSSLERLIGCSLSWALHYHGRLQPGLSDGPGAPGPLLFGTLAHHVLALVLGGGPSGLDRGGAAMIDAELDRAAEDLALPRYQAERTALRQAIGDSARALRAFVARTGAGVRGVELGAQRELDGVNVAGKADLVLEHPDLIIDLKWGKSSNKQRLVDGTALQLAAYAQLFADDAARPEVAYFFLGTQELLGDGAATLPGVTRAGPLRADDTWQGARRSLMRRRAEFGAGELCAPGADGAQIKPALGPDGLVLDPCGYCPLGRLCGRKAAR